MKNLFNKDFALVCIFSLPFILILLTTPFIDANDVIDIQLEGARNLSEGKGYTNSQLNLPQTFNYITSHPIGYSLLISSFIKIGISISVAAKIFKGICYVLGLLAWFKFGIKWINKSLIFQITYLSLLTLHSISVASSSTEMFLWFLMPILSNLILQPNYNDNKNILFINFLIILFILFKYSGLGIIIIMFLWLLYLT